MSTKKNEMIRLSKLMSFVLRHDPTALDLALDAEGWIDLTDFVAAISSQPKWRAVTRGDIETVVTTSDKQRFEIQAGRIRARYGHSRAAQPTYEPVTPPAILYHGTPRRNLAAIQQDGLRAMSRQYVHLSATAEMALTVGRRRDAQPALLKIRAAEAHTASVVFGTPSGEVDDVYLVKALPPTFIDFVDVDEVGDYSSS
jgi:putative RNA 2'-phosphotransferase